MKRRIALVMFFLAARAPAAVRRFEFRYVLGREQNGTVVPVSPLSPFETGDRLRIRVLASQESYCYVAIGRSDGRFELLGASRLAARRLAFADEWVDLPDSGWLRLDQRPGIEMLYLIVTSAPVRELDELWDVGRLSETALLKIRERYQSGVVTERITVRELVRVRIEARDDRPVVVLEPIRLRHR
ncbi:MAG: hypothetical protein ACLQOO_13170 [Terriglobia bacterium]